MLVVATAGPGGAVAAVYVVIAATFRLPLRTSAAIAVVVAGALWLLARRGGYEELEGVWLYAFVGFAITFSMVQLMRRNAELVRARAEVADLERLARATEALRAAGIAADLPSAADAVPTELRGLFAWTVREGVTNVVRHSGARRCAVVLEPHRVVVRDEHGFALQAPR